MRRAVPALIVAVAVALVGAASAVRATPQAAASTTGGSGAGPLINSLSDPDAAVRKQASEQLRAMGVPARPELLRAARSSDPEIRARAAELLMKLPWDAPGDPRAARGLLSRYGSSNDEQRKVLVQQISHVDGGDVTLLRLLREEPSDVVRWRIVYELAVTRDSEQLRRIREATWLAESNDDPPALLLAGRAWIERDKPRGLALLRRAIDAEGSRPTGETMLMGFAYEQLIDAALASGEYDAAANLLRRRIPRSEQQASASRRARQARMLDSWDFDDDQMLPALPRLMALHALFGPLDRFEFDVRTWGQEDTAKPTLARQVAFLFARLGAAPPLVCQPIDLLGEEHFAAASYLFQHELPMAAAIEGNLALAAPRKLEPQRVQANVQFLRGQLAIKAGDDAAAADALEQGMRLKAETRSRFIRNVQSDDDVWAQIHFLRAKAALAKGDAKTVDARVHDLSLLEPSNMDLSLSIIDWLKQHDRATTGKAMFEKLYVQAKAKLDSANAEYTPEYQNDLAWLCARSGERLDEAVTLARTAVDASPENAAFLDTLAECEFRAGRVDEAVKNETKALELNPDNKFMREQLERFKAKQKKD